MGKKDSRSRSPPRKRSSRRSPSRRKGRDRSSSRSRSPPRRGRGRDSRRRSRSRSPPKRGGGGSRPGSSSYRIPPPARRAGGGDSGGSGQPQLTPEMRAASIEHEGFLYATIDFTPPHTLCEHSSVVPKGYDGKRCTDDSVLQWNNMPNGWKQVPGDIPDSVKEKVIGAYAWGTHLLVIEDGKAYATAGCGGKDGRGTSGGSLQMIWELEKGPGRLKLQRLGGSQSFWFGKLFIRCQIN
eukprot:TRINITY_DN92173_c0_g1_i1.p1 TRINITY_DN92173_c0_g1~~TRINITY_DN92173_c0_g1_i1.p1  ORF type:complete len:239 (+),score=27.53 TRINITY_DN92173_c0_g1_i1:49-765(+)